MHIPQWNCGLRFTSCDYACGCIGTLRDTQHKKCDRTSRGVMRLDLLTALFTTTYCFFFFSCFSSMARSRQSRPSVARVRREYVISKPLSKTINRPVVELCIATIGDVVGSGIVRDLTLHKTCAMWPFTLSVQKYVGLLKAIMPHMGLPLLTLQDQQRGCLK